MSFNLVILIYVILPCNSDILFMICKASIRVFHLHFQEKRKGKGKGKMEGEEEGGKGKTGEAKMKGDSNH